MRTTIGQMTKERLYAMIYGEEGSGKTALIMTLRTKDDGSDIAFITPEPSGPTSVISLGYSARIPVEILSADSDPTEECIKAIESFSKDKTITGICIDGTTVMCGRMIDFLSDGEGEKALGFEGWQQILSNFRAIERAAEKATRLNKSVIYTAWQAEPKYEATLAGQSLTERGRPLLQGNARKWLPGNCDIVARMTSSFKKEVDPKTKKAISKWSGQLHVNATDEWLAKSRWKLPSPMPADLKAVLNALRSQAAAAKK